MFIDLNNQYLRYFVLCFSCCWVMWWFIGDDEWCHWFACTCIQLSRDNICTKLLWRVLCEKCCHFVLFWRFNRCGWEICYQCSWIVTLLTAVILVCFNVYVVLCIVCVACIFDVVCWTLILYIVTWCSILRYMSVWSIAINMCWYDVIVLYYVCIQRIVCLICFVDMSV